MVKVNILLAILFFCFEVRAISDLDRRLLDAAIKGVIEAVKYLIEHEANVNAELIGKWTPLHVAAWNGHTDVVKYLIEHGANVSAEDIDKLTPLHRAAWKGHTDVVKYLIEHGANVSAEDIDKLTPLHMAAQNGHTDVVKYLIEHGANVSAEDIDKLTPLHMAARNGHTDVVKYLIEHGANVSAKDKNKWTPLHRAAENGHKDTVKYLAQHEANINARNERNQTPLELATGYKEIAKFLLEYENISKAKYACSQFPTVQRVTSYLTQGDLAEEGEFPWMAALVYVAGLKISFRCGGTIISERYIMTAAHCTSAYPPVLVRLGKVNRADESASNYQIEYYIKNIIRHPNYSMRTYKNDIALLQLRNRILFNDNIRPACLYTDMGDIDNRTKLIVTGWGNTIPGDRDSQSDLLLKIAINTMPLSECNATYLNHFALKNQTAFRDGLDDGQYCAHDPDGQDPFIRDACQGDSGGPLTHIPNNDPNEATIVGIVSFGYSCALELPGIYTRVAHYIPWIVSVVWP